MTAEPQWLTPESTTDYLVTHGRLSNDDVATVRPLAWGVSNLVMRVDIPGKPSFIVKQSRPQLRTKIEWLSRCERIYREADVLRTLTPLFAEGIVPRVLWEDRPNFVLGLEAIRSDHVVWKEQLLHGDLHLPIADRLGSILATIHTGTFGKPECLPDSDDWSLFDELRTDPFYRYIARVHPVIQQPIDDLLAAMAAHRMCLVHADFSPKNVLVHPDGVSLVDFETGHWGDPAFDLGFFLSHLLLKSLLQHPRNLDRWVLLVNHFWSRNRRGVTNARTGLNVDDISRRSPRHLAACLLARIDGKSPVDYLQEDWQREFVRRHALAWIVDPPTAVEQLISEWFLDLQAA